MLKIKNPIKPDHASDAMALAPFTHRIIYLEDLRTSIGVGDRLDLIAARCGASAYGLPTYTNAPSWLNYLTVH